MGRIILDYVVGFILLAFGVSAVMGGASPWVVAVGILAGVIGLLMIIGRILAGRQKV